MQRPHRRADSAGGIQTSPGIRLRLRAQGLPSPILVRTDFDSYDESLFWRSLTSHMILPSVLEGTGPLPAVGDACDHAGPSP